MKLNKTLMTAAIAAAITLTACGGDGPTGEKQAEAVEARYRELAEAANQRLQVWAQGDVSSISYAVDSYQRGAQTSKGEELFTLKLAGESPIQLRFSDQIDHADALRKNKVLANISTTVSIPNDASTLSTDEVESLNQFLKHLKIETSLLDDKGIKQIVSIDSIGAAQTDGAFSYAGFKSTFEGKEPSGKDLFSTGKGSFQSGAFDSGAEDVHIDAFSGTSKSTADSLDVQIDRLHSITDGNDINISGISYSGSGLKVDGATSQVLGKQQLKADSISITPKGKPPFQLKNLALNSETSASGKNFDYSADASIDFDTDILRSAIGITGLKLQTIKLGIELKNISPATYQALQEVSEEGGANVQKGLQGFADNGSSLHIDASIKTEAGDASLKGHLQSIKGASITGSNADSLGMSFFTQMEGEADLVIPVKLLQATGMSASFELYAGPYVKKDGNNYVSHAEIHGTNITINGRPLQ